MSLLINKFADKLKRAIEDKYNNQARILLDGIDPTRYQAEVRSLRTLREVVELIDQVRAEHNET